MILTYKCPNCGGGLQFDPNTQKHKCEFCFSVFTQEELEALYPKEKIEEAEDGENQENTEAEGKAQTEKIRYAGGREAAKGAGQECAQAECTEHTEYAENREHTQNTEETANTVLYQCPNCGAQIVTDETTAATFCYYCHNPVVLSGRVSGTFRPNEVIPFAIDRKKAEQIFVDWIHKKRFVPNDFFSKSQIEKLSGIYFPYWMFDCQIDGSLEGEGTNIRTWQSGDKRYTETKRFSVSCSGSMDIKNIARNALQKADKDLIEGVLPYDMTQVQPFSAGYLSGFGAEKRDMESAAFQETLHTELEQYAKSDLKGQAETGYSRLMIRHQNVRIRNEVWNYVLLPVWVLTYQDKVRDKMYYFALNGQTGKICGQLPVDYKKLMVLFAGIFFPLLVLFLIGGYWI